MLTLENLTFDVNDDEGGKGIIKDLNLTIGDGKFVVITGPNGGGKSTTAKLIMGIEKPTSGRILFDGQDITDMNITDRANLGISFAFQQPVRFKGVQVLDLIRLAAKKKLSVTDACQYLSEVGLCAKDYINREVNASLSGGELKRIEIATVLARGTKLSVFDEPEAVSYTHLLLHVLDLRVLSHEEAVDAVVAGVGVAAVVDAAAGHNGHVAVIPDVEIVGHHLG